MSILANDFVEFARRCEPERTNVRLGDALAGELSDVEVDSVEAVRELRERG
ncbi:MAG: hypothetical protein ACQETI_03110 [Halobacteriota archaeon]